jgi:hypothetical protein
MLYSRNGREAPVPEQLSDFPTQPGNPNETRRLKEVSIEKKVWIIKKPIPEQQSLEMEYHCKNEGPILTKVKR